MDNRSVAIIMALFAAGELSLYELSIQTGLDKADLLANLQDINGLLEAAGFLPIQVQEGVYRVPEALRQDQAKCLEWLKSQALYLSQEERQVLLYLYTFIRKEFVSNHHYQALLGVSRNTTLADIKALRALCQDFQVGFDYSRAKGYHLTGQEQDKHRLALFAISSCLKSPIGVWALDYLLQAWSASNHLTQLKQVAQQVSRFYQRPVLEERLDEFLYFLQYLAIRQPRDLEQAAEQAPLTDTTSQDMVKALWKTLTQTGPLRPDWLAYLTQLLQGCLEGQDASEAELFHKLTLAIVEEMERLAVINFTQRTDLIQGLKRHLIPAYARLSRQLVTVNAYTEVIKTEHEALFELVKKALRPLEQQLGFEVPDSEVAYFVIHFGGYLETAQERPFRYRALVVCPNGMSSALIVKENLKQLFPNIHFADTHSLVDFESLQLEDYDLIFSTIKVNTLRPFFLVPLIMSLTQKRELFHLVNEQFPNAGYVPIEIEQLLSLIGKHATIHHEQALKYELVQFLNEKSYQGKERSPMLDELITRETYRYVNKPLSWQAAIALAAQPLLDLGHIEPSYIQAMVDKVQEFGPFIDLGKGVAIPHARPEDGVKTVGMSMLRLAQPVCLLDDPNHEVSLLICIAAVDNQTHLKALSHLTTILRDNQNIQQLTSSTCFDDIADLLKEEN